ncbi:g6432 [Coccomyxa viridis]|uniref:G6432 protein n=1 Tax=Coccomyxa viridis TaxID=1274662 RepID=A0ABP1FXX8_9CHLO
MDTSHNSASAALPEGLEVPSTISSNVLGARSDNELRLALLTGRAGSVIVNYGSSWCAHCHELFPHFYDLARQFPQHRCVVAQVDYMKDALQGVKVTPTFAVFKKGRKIDQFFGPSPQQLRDRVWLHSDDADDC